VFSLKLLNLNKFLLDKKSHLFVLRLHLVMISRSFGELLFDGGDIFLVLLHLLELALETVQLRNHFDVPPVQVAIQLGELCIPTHLDILRKDFALSFLQLFLQLFDNELELCQLSLRCFSVIDFPLKRKAQALNFSFGFDATFLHYETAFGNLFLQLRFFLFVGLHQAQ